MPKRLISQLGLRPTRKRRVITAMSPAEVQLLDFLIDSQRRGLIGNPAHGGEQMLEMF